MQSKTEVVATTANKTVAAGAAVVGSQALAASVVIVVLWSSSSSPPNEVVIALQTIVSTIFGLASGILSVYLTPNHIKTAVLMLAVSLSLGLSACSTPPTIQDRLREVATTPPPPGPIVAPVAKTPIVAKTVAAAQIALTHLERLALRYTSLPECVAGGPRLCHDPIIKTRIKEYDNYAFNTVMAARRGAARLEDAVGAINAFQAVIPIF